MTSTVIIMGAKGRFGRAATKAFKEAGWTVKAMARNWSQEERVDDIELVECDASDARKLRKICVGTNVIVNALNPPYERWASELSTLTNNVILAAKSNSAVVMIPGNIYNYGLEISPVITEATKSNPNTKKGKLRVDMEAAYRKAADDGVRTIVLRAGDFIERANTGNWFDSHIAVKAHQGKTMYPGPRNLSHAWAYLPDMARAMASLAEIREQLNAFEEFGFEGYNLTGHELIEHITKATGKKQKISSMPWLIVSVVSVFSRKLSEVLEMRYLWQVPHRIDGNKLRSVLKDFSDTPIEIALSDVLAR